MQEIKIVEDENMNCQRQRILNSFKQGHILNSYQQMTQKQQDSITEQLELLEFDMIDLVFFLC